MKSPAPRLVTAGHVTRDVIRGKHYLGGAAAFAARMANALEVPNGLVTVAPGDFEFLPELSALGHCELHRQDANSATVFELNYSGPTRTLRVREQAPDVDPDDIPEPFLHTPLLYLAPVINECSRALAERFENAWVTVGLQGWLRRLDATGTVCPSLRKRALRPPSNCRLVCFSELDHPRAADLAERLADLVPLVALTRGARGASIYADGKRRDWPAAAAEEVDPTGAGDVFGLVLSLRLQCGDELDAATEKALFAAARVVEGPGLGNFDGSSVLRPE